MDWLAKVAYDKWRATGGLSTALAPEFEGLSRQEQQRWDEISQAVLSHGAEEE